MGKMFGDIDKLDNLSLLRLYLAYAQHCADNGPTASCNNNCPYFEHGEECGRVLLKELHDQLWAFPPLAMLVLSGVEEYDPKARRVVNNE